MAFSILSYTGNGVQTDYSVSFPYIAKSHVQVFINSVLQVLTTNYTWLNDSTIRFNVAPANGAPIQLRRGSSQATALVDFQDASILTETDLDTATLQGFYVAQEAIDGATTAMQLDTDNKYNSTGKVIKNLANGSASQDAVTVAQLEAAAMAPVSPQASSISFAPGGGVAASNVQAAIVELDTEKAPKDAPTFTGAVDMTAATVAVPTMPVGNSAQSAASTAFVQGELTSGRNPNVPVRQTVLSGALSSGVPAALTTGSGLLPGLNASPTPIVITFANGFGAVGSVDTVSVVSASASTIGSALPANNTSFIYAERTGDTSVTWGQTQIPPQYGETFNRTRSFTLNFEGANASTSIIDDNGNTWSAFGNAQISTAQFKFGSSSLLCDGAGDYVLTNSITNMPETGWTYEGFVRFNALPGSTSYVCLGAFASASGRGAVLYLYNNSGTYELRMGLSSDGTNNNILASTSGSAITAPSVGVWYHFVMTHDLQSGAFRNYWGGSPIQGQATSAAVGSIDRVVIGVDFDGTSNPLNGWIDGVQFVPYCKYPNATPFTPPNSAPSVAPAHFFSIPEMRMYEVTAASASAGTNPTMTRRDRVFVGEAYTNSTAVSSVRTYAYRGRYASAAVAMPSAGAASSFSHNIGVENVNLKFTAQCILSEANFTVGHSLDVNGYQSAGPHAMQTNIRSGRNSCLMIYTTGFVGTNPATGAITSLTLANWRMTVRAERAW